MTGVDALWFGGVRHPRARIRAERLENFLAVLVRGEHQHVHGGRFFFQRGDAFDAGDAKLVRDQGWKRLFAARPRADALKTGRGIEQPRAVDSHGLVVLDDAHGRHGERGSGQWKVTRVPPPGALSIAHEPPISSSLRHIGARAHRSARTPESSKNSPANRHFLDLENGQVRRRSRSD